jgi:hypothetical protein
MDVGICFLCWQHHMCGFRIQGGCIHFHNVLRGVRKEPIRPLSSIISPPAKLNCLATP